MEKLNCVEGTMFVVLLILITLITGCGAMEKAWNIEGSMYRAVGAPVDLQPVAPAGATNVQKVGNQWTCEANGERLVFNDATVRWEPQPKQK